MFPTETVKAYVRLILLFMLGASFATFVGAVLIKGDSDRRFLERRVAAEERIEEQQRRLEERLAKLEQGRVSDTDQLRLLAERQDDLDRGRQGSQSSKAPFKIGDIVGAVVELVCIDNANKDVYYTGSGVVVEKKGLIVTNRHILVSEDGSAITFCGVGFTTDVQKPPRVEYAAKSVAMHPDSDLALLAISEHLEGKALPAAFQALPVDGISANVRRLSLGDAIYIAGYPGIGAETFTFTEGVVSGRVGEDLIKTSALIDSGTSGGAAFDGNGRYVGVPTAAARGEIGGSLGYLIGGDVVESFVKQYQGRK